ncbi:ABC transporter permease [Actinocorallia sp. API 0066]|uniref:ABC transporter permease n=1 Tax=Actinocorallia sp. API 0066 TaxID=2896846 RepID=UPI001E4B44AD|nr:ABC transporter permease [Actinocorallia sp. API 0066]MCD0453105.1 ABC transporter permease [Actinocorallia sp. API 0066]
MVPRLRLVDVLAESALSVVRHPGRSLVTALGAVLGAAAFVSVLGLSSTLGSQVSDAFDARRATEVVVNADADGPATDAAWQGGPALKRLTRLNGVTAAGARVRVPGQEVRRAAAFTATTVTAPVVGLDPASLGVVGPRLVAGRAFDRFHEDNAVPVVMLPRTVADALGIARTGVAVFIADRAYTVIGVFDDVARQPDTLTAVVMPFATVQPLAEGDVSDQVKRSVLVETSPGAARLVASQAPLALRPEGPDGLQAVAPADPQTLRREVEGEVTRFALLVSGVALVIGAVSIGNAATAGLAVRVSEIGLRRAVGGRPVHIFVQLVGETTVLGGFGGVLGALLGVVTTGAVSLYNGWVPVLDLRVAVLASLGGAAAGLAAGFVPALRATRLQPVNALHR